MGGYVFLGVFLAVTASIAVGVLVIRAKLKRFSKQVLGTDDLGKVVDALQEQQTVDAPKSVSGLDRLLMPRILKDFPDFDGEMAKTYARQYIEKQLADKKELTIHRVVFSQYVESQSQKTIIMQAAVAYRQGERLVQTRYELHYSYMVESTEDSVAANCPNCGATLGFGATVCAYCGARVLNVLGNTWKFTRFTEK